MIRVLAGVVLVALVVGIVAALWLAIRDGLQQDHRH